MQNVHFPFVQNQFLRADFSVSQPSLSRRSFLDRHLFNTYTCNSTAPSVPPGPASYRFHMLSCPRSRSNDPLVSFSLHCVTNSIRAHTFTTRANIKIYQISEIPWHVNLWKESVYTFSEISLPFSVLVCLPILAERRHHWAPQITDLRKGHNSKMKHAFMGQVSLFL